jgi:CRP/FNR family transcriptional regulator
LARTTPAQRGRSEIDLSDVRLSDVAGRGFLGRLSPDLVEELARSGRPASYPAGTVISSSRDESGPAVVLSGSLRYFLSAPDGRQLTIRYLLPGDLVGTVIAEQSNVSSNTELLEPGVIFHLDRERFRALTNSRPDLAEAVIDELVTRLRLAYRAVAAHAFLSVRTRVAMDLVERASMSGSLRAGVHFDVTQQSLADATGSVREVVSRALRDLRLQGVVAGSGDGVTVLDPEGLSRAAAM